jgi:hypothetical protein
MRKIMITGIVLLSFLALVSIVSAGAVVTNLVVNGGFEAPVDTQTWQLFPDGTGGTGWDVSWAPPGPSIPGKAGVAIETAENASLAPFEGNQYADLNAHGSGTRPGRVSVSQLIPQVKGESYNISFAQSCDAPDPAGQSRLGIYWGTKKLDQTTCSAGTSPSWVVHNYTVTATSDTPVKLTLADEGNATSPGVLIDGVEVGAVNNTMPVPEFPLGVIPAFMFGFVGLIHMIRKENK